MLIKYKLNVNLLFIKRKINRFIKWNKASE